MQMLMDRAEIEDLLASMTRLLNDQRIDAYLECYVPDGIFELVGGPPLQGHEAIGAMMRALPGVVHMTTDSYRDRPQRRDRGQQSSRHLGKAGSDGKRLPLQRTLS